MSRPWVTWIVLMLLLAPMARAADDVSVAVTGSVQGGYARLLFDWTDEVTGSAVATDGVVVITFDHSIDFDIAALTRSLDPYVSLIRRDPDGKSIRLALKGPIRLKTTNLVTRYAFDLVPPSYRGDPPPPPAPKSLSASRELVIKVAERQNTTRLDFEFPGKASFTSKLVNGRLQVTFSKEAKVNLRRFLSAPPTWIRAARSEVVDGKLRIEFDVDEKADFQDLSREGSLAIELREPRSDQAVSEEQSVAPGDAGLAGMPRVIIPQAQDNAPPPPVLVADTIIFAPIPRKGSQVIAEDRTIQPAQEALASDPRRNTDARAIETAGLPPQTSEAEPVQDDSASALPVSLRLGQSDLTAALAPLPAATAATPGKARAEIFGSMLRLELPYSSLPPAAIFRRGLAIWVVTQAPEVMDLEALAALPNAPARILSRVTEILPGITAFRLEAPVPMSVSVSAVGNSWVLAIGNTVPELPRQLQLVRQTEGQITRMRAQMPGITQVTWVRDPDSGDRIAAVLGHGPARGVSDGRNFVEFSALPSQQGIAIRAIADDLMVTVDGGDAVISRPKGLNVSPVQAAELVDPTLILQPGRDGPAAVDFKVWGRQLRPTRADTILSLIHRSSKSPGGMSAPRMALVRYYIAEGFAAEALGVLRVIADDDRTAETNAQYRVARALANLQMARYREALADLAIEELGTDPHAALWRGLAAAGARDWRLARSNLMSGLKVVTRYPAEWQARARIALAKVALELGEPGTAKQSLEGMPRAVLPTDLSAEATLARALTEQAMGKTDQAIALLDRLTGSDYKPVAARAKLKSILIGIKSGKKTPDKAIDELERLRFQWRGDEVELETLTELGKLYVANNRIRDGLNTMRLAVRHFDGADEARLTATEMSKIFEDIFLSGKAAKMPPLQALALFYDYKELTPAGAQGDEMIRKLAERLVDVDLLPQAAELLQHQVDQRLDGVAKASVATRLALIYLLDRQSQKALDAIRNSRQSRLPDDLILQRDLIEARALANTRKFDQALDIIASDLSSEADRLRADIYWDSQDWPMAASKAEALVGDRFADERPLSEIERSDVMRACVGYSLAGDTASLERMRSRFSRKMQGSADSRAFTMITQPVNVQNADYKALVKQVASADTLDAFLSEFRARYGTLASQPPASAVN